MSDRGNDEAGAREDGQDSPEKTRLLAFFTNEKPGGNGTDPEDGAQDVVPGEAAVETVHAVAGAMPEEPLAAGEDAAGDGRHDQHTYVFDDTAAAAQTERPGGNPAILNTPMPAVRTMPGTQPRPTPSPVRPVPQPAESLCESSSDASSPDEPAPAARPVEPPSREPVPHAARGSVAPPRDPEPAPALKPEAYRPQPPATTPPQVPADPVLPRHTAPAPGAPPADAVFAAARETPAPANKESLASVIAGRSFENTQAERAFLLTLSRDQRMKYAELVHADERLELDLERHNLEVDRLVHERERAEISERTRHRDNAFAFANNALRMLFALNGIGAVVLMGIWGYLAGVPDARFLSAAFGVALTVFAGGTACSALTAVCSYGAQTLMADPDDSPARHYGTIGVRVMAIVFAALAFCLFLAGVILAGYGLRAS